MCKMSFKLNIGLNMQYLTLIFFLCIFMGLSSKQAINCTFETLFRKALNRQYSSVI